MAKQTKTIALRVRQSGAIGAFYMGTFTLECNEGESIRDAWYRLYGDRYEPLAAPGRNHSVNRT